MMKLFPHQEAALKFAEGKTRVAFYHDMGTGKTFTGAECAVRMDSRTILVVCQKSKVQDWINHFEEHYQKSWVFNLTTENGLKEYLHYSNAVHDSVAGNALKIGVINYDLIFRRKQILNLKNFTLILDESSLIQNAGTNRSKFILQLNPSNVILLSGTPTGGKYENLWTQLHLLGWNISEKIYDTHYVNYKKIKVGDHIHKVVDKDDPYKNVERLKQKMHDYGCDFLKTEEVFDLPEQMFIPIKVPVTREYLKFKRDRLITIDGIEFVGDSLLAYRLYQRQLCTAYNPNKIQAFKDILESTQDRLIVFYSFNCELEQLKSICHDLERPVSMVNGTVKDLTAYEQETNSVTLIQWQSGSMGLNLQKANKTVYFSLTESAENWMQAHKRTNRIGQERSCFYYILLCKDSIEEKIMDCLNRGVDFTNELFLEG